MEPYFYEPYSPESWIATVPDPLTFILAALGILAIPRDDFGRIIPIRQRSDNAHKKASMLFIKSMAHLVVQRHS